MFAAVAVCRYQRYGRGGGQETKGALCVLSLNMINDKVAILLSSYSPYCRHCAGVRYPVGVALSPHPGRPQQDRHQEHPAALTQGEVLPHEDDDAQVMIMIMMMMIW